MVLMSSEGEFHFTRTNEFYRSGYSDQEINDMVANMVSAVSDWARNQGYGFETEELYDWNSPKAKFRLIDGENLAEGRIFYSDGYGPEGNLIGIRSKRKEGVELRLEACLDASEESSLRDYLDAVSS